MGPGSSAPVRVDLRSEPLLTHEGLWHGRPRTAADHRFPDEKPSVLLNGSSE